MIKMELRCPDFWFKVSNINLEEIPRKVTSFDENNYITSFDENNHGEDFYFKREIEEDLFCKFENYLLNSAKGLTEIERWAEQILYSFRWESFQNFIRINNIDTRFLKEEIFHALNKELIIKIRENSSMVLIDEDSGKTVGYYDFKEKKVIKYE